jgi:hypothetical protein
MTETNSPTVFDFDTWQAQERERLRLITEMRPANKAALCDALTQAGISVVEVTFDGSGDSGQIETVEARAGDTPAELPPEPIEFAEPDEHGDARRTMLTPAECIEKFVYDLLEETHSGWEINDGAYGEFTFDVEAKTITLAFNERYTDSQYFEHLF